MALNVSAQQLRAVVDDLKARGVPAYSKPITMNQLLLLLVRLADEIDPKGAKASDLVKLLPLQQFAGVEPD